MHRAASIAGRLALLLPLLAAPAMAQDDEREVPATSFDIQHFSYNQSRKAFVYRGRVTGGLPEKTKMVAILTLNGQVGASDNVFVKEGGFSGEFATGEAEVVPGTYVLQIVVRRTDQQGAVRNEYPSGLDEDAGTKHFGWQAAQAGREAEKIRRAIAKEVATIRKVYDDAAQLGQTALKRIDQALAGKAPEDVPRGKRDQLLKDLWLGFFQETTGTLPAGAEKFRVAHDESTFVSPYQKAVDGVLKLYEFVEFLRSSYTVQILTKLGMEGEIPGEVREKGRFPPKTIISQVNGVAWSIQTDLGTDITVWMPTIEIARERGTQQGNTWVSSTSGFKITRPNEGWVFVTGEADSTMRLALNLQSDDGPVLSSIQVHMVQFPWADTKEELAEAWERLAEYEWPNYRKVSGSWQTDSTTGREHYVFRFRTRSEFVSTVVSCYLHVPSGGKWKNTIYGVMEVSFYEGIMRHHAEDDYATILESFELVE